MKGNFAFVGLVALAACGGTSPPNYTYSPPTAPASVPLSEPVIQATAKCPVLGVDEAKTGGVITPVAGFRPTEASIIGRWLPTDNDAGTVITDAGYSVFSAGGRFASYTPTDPGVDTVRGSYNWNAGCQQFGVTYAYGGTQLDTWHQESPNAIRRVRTKDLASGNAISDGELWIRSGSAEFEQRGKVKQGPLPPLLNAPPTGWVDPAKLARGSKYRISKDTPLMPAPDPVDVYAAIAAMQTVPEGSVITIVAMRRNPTNPWYSVTVNGLSGWINSGALIGQTLTRVP
jgi:hypothetical protein